MNFKKSLFFLVLVFATSCKPEDREEPKPLDQEYISITFSTYWGSELMNPDSTYFDHEGRPFRLYDFNILFTNLQLIDSQGDSILLPKNRFLTKLGRNTLQLPSFKKESFNEYYIRFGVDSLTNATVEPTMISDSNDPFFPQSPAMWWTWAHGFIFARIEGYTDWSNDFGNQGTEVFGYHLGAFNFDRVIGPFTSINLEGSSAIALRLDVKKVFDGLNFPEDNNTHSFDNPKLTEKIINLICSNIEESL